MESKNVLIAVLLSSIVIVVWGLFFEPVVQQPTSENELVTKDENSYPSIDEKNIKEEVDRGDVINTTNRIKVENQNTILMYGIGR